MNEIECNEVGTLQGGMYDKIHEQSRRVYGPDGLSPTIHTMGGGGQEVKVLDEQNNIIRDDYVGSLTTDGSSPKHNNRVIEGLRDAEVIGGVGEMRSNNGTQFYLQDRIYDGDIGISVCSAFNPNYIDRQFRIRKLTPRECWRLMDFTDEQFDRARKVNSDSQLYKQAGNSICVGVLVAILRNLMEDK